MAKKKKKSQNSLPPAALLLTPGQKRLYAAFGWVAQHLFALLTLAVIPLTVWAVFGLRQPAAPEDAVTIDQDNIYVSDNAHLLTAKTKATIKGYNEDYKKRPNRPQLMVITINALPRGESIESYTRTIANQLGVGDATANSGVVYLIAKDDRKARLEVGYGMEATIPDIMTNRITDEKVKDYYRDDDYNAGVQLVVQRINNLITKGEVGQDATVQEQPVTQQLWQWLTTSTFMRVVYLALLAFLIYQCRARGLRALGRVYLDTMARAYTADVKRIDASLTDPAAILARSGNQQAIKAARQQLKDQWAQTGKPDYADMQFAGGRVAVASFLADLEPDRPQTTSMYAAHWQDWYRGKRWWGVELALQPKATYAPKDNAAIAPNLLSPAQKTRAQVGGFCLRNWTWLLVVVLVAGAVLMQFEDDLAGWLMDHPWLLAISTWFHNISDTQLSWLLVVGVWWLLVWYVVHDWTSTRGKRLRQRVRLDALMRHFLADLAALDPQLGDAQAIATAVDTKQPAAQAAIDQLEAAAPAKKKARADYHDMAFAFGNIYNATVILATETHGVSANSSIYLHHRDWYDERRGNSSGGGSSSSGGGDSFGGGSFGGGGGTSSW